MTEAIILATWALARLHVCAPPENYPTRAVVLDYVVIDRCAIPTTPHVSASQVRAWYWAARKGD